MAELKTILVGGDRPIQVPAGVRMAGRMGMDRVTTRNHPLVSIDVQNNLLLIKGALPGPNGGLLFVRKSVTARPKTAPVASAKKGKAEKKK